MKVTTKAIAAIMLMFAAVLVAGCTKDNYSHDDENTDKVTINPEYVPIDWETTTVTTYDDSTGDYTIQFTDRVPDIHPGSVIAIDRDTVVLYRFVLTANVNGNTMSLTTDDADLTDIFYDTEITLTTDASSKSNTKGAVFRPVAAYATNGSGGYKPLNMSKGDTRFTHNLWHYGFNFDGYVIDQGLYHQLLLDQMNMDLDFDLEMYMNFGGREISEVVTDALVRYMSRALQINAALVGRFNTEQQIRLKVWGGCSVTSPSITLKNDVFPDLTIKFMAGPVPIILKLRSDLCCKVAMSGSGEIQAYTGFTDHAEGRIGFEWSQSGGISPVTTFENTFNFTPPTLEGKGQIQGKAWLYPRISVLLYDIIGPAFELMPYLADTVHGGYREQLLGQTNDYCAWSNDLHTGMDFGCELNLNIFKRQIWNDVAGWPIPSYQKHIVDIKLFHSPKKVLHASGRPQGGQTATVRFDVYDTSYITYSTFKTILPQIVKFEASGDLSSEYGIAHDGTVQVNWTPNGNDTLWAKLYDQDGNVLSFDTVIVRCDCNLTSGDWVDLGLPSGLLWATRNVGASSPSDYGNYYAWGETSPKSVYNVSTYRYCQQCDPSHPNWYFYTKYNYCQEIGCNGYTDTLTILQPIDDAATVNYGGRTPSPSEWQELVDNTTRHSVYINGVYGLCFTGHNGNSIFLPGSGCWFDTLPPHHIIGEIFLGEYWSNSLCKGAGDRYLIDPERRVEYAERFTFRGMDLDWDVYDHQSRDLGCSVRAVR